MTEEERILGILDERSSGLILGETIDLAYQAVGRAIENSIEDHESVLLMDVRRFITERVEVIRAIDVIVLTHMDKSTLI